MGSEKNGARKNGGRGNGVATLRALKKAQDRIAEPAILLVDDAPAMKFLAAWTCFPVAWRSNGEKVPDKSEDRWAWAWAGCRFTKPGEFFTDLAVSAGDLPFRVEAKWKMLKANRLIYPDGSANLFAMKLLRGIVYQGIGEPVPRDDTGV